jgi:hypothetical protein
MFNSGHRCEGAEVAGAKLAILGQFEQNTTDQFSTTAYTAQAVSGGPK